MKSKKEIVTDWLPRYTGTPLEIFGNHNLENLEGAKWICQHMGIDEDE